MDLPHKMLPFEQSYQTGGGASIDHRGQSAVQQVIAGFGRLPAPPGYHYMSTGVLMKDPYLHSILYKLAAKHGNERHSTATGQKAFCPVARQPEALRWPLSEESIRWPHPNGLRHHQHFVAVTTSHTEPSADCIA